MNRWLLPIRLMVVFLAVMALGATIAWNGQDMLGWGLSLLDLSLLLAGNLLVRVLLSRTRFALRSPWEHHAITTLILYLLFDSLTPWWFFFILGALTRALEQLLRLPSGPFFNPAALGALVASIIGFLPTWWGTNFAPRFPLFEGGMSLAGILTLVIAGYIAYRYRKLPIAASGLVIFCLAYLFLFEANPIPVAFEGTLLFFFLVMAVEPKTSPVTLTEQLIYGTLIGGIIPLLLSLGFIEAYLGALLLGNLYHRRTAIFSVFRRSPQTPLATPSLSPQMPRRRPRV